MIDTHCHIHSTDFPLDQIRVIEDSIEAGVNKLICVGTSVNDSRTACDFVKSRQNLWAAVGIHPHDAETDQKRVAELEKLAKLPKVVAIGECGLDYWYEYSHRDIQKVVFEKQLKIGLKQNLPFIFHVRGSRNNSNDAFDDFLKIIEKYNNIRGVVHSFSAGQQALKRVLSKPLMIGVNGIATFAKPGDDLLLALQSVPGDCFLLETDSPLLTPTPKRGKVNQPKYMGYTAKFMAELRGEGVKSIIAQTTTNAENLFGI